tara:strand:+ start:152 stop:376 length:225 start_codon:yes stop_codon:yes gene_type:complete
MQGVDIEELKSFLAKRGEVDLLNVIKHIEEEYEKSIDPDYSEEESETESECSTSDIVQEEIEVNPSMNGFCSLA